MRLLDLNVDCLLRIFSYSSEHDLVNLCRAHPFLRQVIDDNIFYRRTLDLLMCGHRNNACIIERTQLPISYANRLSIGRNWVQGRYHEREYFHHARMFPMKLQLERDYLYLTHTGYIRQYRRIRAEPLQRRYQREITTSARTDIAHFVKKRDTLFAGRICGSCFIYEDGDIATEQQLHAPKEYMHCVDFCGSVYATSTNTLGKLWRRSDEMGLCHLDFLCDLKDAYKSLQFSSSGELLFAGIYTDVCRRALRELDVERNCERILNSNTISIYDLKLKDEHVIFTANFDTTFRMYDRRTNRDEQIWEDPFDSSFYCLEYDGLYGVLCGAKYHGRVNLYDIRVPGKYVQLYFPLRNDRYGSSPVYSIACDSRYLFVALDHDVRVYDFKTSCAPIRDYAHIFRDMRRY